MTNECRNSLLRAHYCSEADKKKFHHPIGAQEKAIREWLNMWSMWCYIDHVGCLMIEEFAKDAWAEAKVVKFSGTGDEFVETQKKLYRDFVQEKSLSIGNLIWQFEAIREECKRGLVKMDKEVCDEVPHSC
ncbi:unnamed protein product [Calypogeia fissa]